MTHEVAGGGRREGSRGLAAGDRRPATERRGLPLPFPGGLISGALVVLAIEPEGRHALIWVALVPFLVSLERNRGRTGARILHALYFGVVLASYVLWSGAVSGAPTRSA